MSYAIVYSSKTGNTKILADTLHDCLPQEGCDYFGIPDPAAMEADTLYVGFWTDKGNADESTSDFLKQLHGKNIFLFGTAGFGGSKEYFDKILKKVEHSLDKSNTVFGSFMCQGKMPMSVRQRYENMKKQPLHLPNLDAMIENFDKALSHPDADDLERLKQAAEFAHSAGLRVNAGHGIDYENIAGILTVPHLCELNIGHSIVGRAVMIGMVQAVREMVRLMQAYRG